MYWQKWYGRRNRHVIFHRQVYPGVPIDPRVVPEDADGNALRRLPAAQRYSQPARDVLRRQDQAGRADYEDLYARPGERGLCRYARGQEHSRRHRVRLTVEGRFGKASRVAPTYAEAHTWV